ncbi:MAG: hypothetical protein SFT94_13080 [Pseudanabaenaceae cyanobacterium bins.68]|nr:hypothetical protein [Pseudanabaenaceae cyanobacterium bins.68]
MIETVILSLIFFDVGMIAVLAGKASKRFERLSLAQGRAEEIELEIELLINLAMQQANGKFMGQPSQVSVNLLPNPVDLEMLPEIWQSEFKIVRSSTNGFRGKDSLRYVCEQEAKAGWVLWEKLDNQRLRFRRLIAARQFDHLCTQDPYRTYYGMPPEVSSLLSLLAVVVLLVVPSYWGFTFIRNQLEKLQTRDLEFAPRPLPQSSKGEP